MTYVSTKLRDERAVADGRLGHSPDDEAGQEDGGTDA
jgi:hypothetical protein